MTNVSETKNFVSSTLKCLCKVPCFCRIQFRYGSVWGPERGYTGNAAPQNEVSFDPGTFVDRISLWFGTVLDSVTLFSENGKFLVCEKYALNGIIFVVAGWWN